MKTFERILIKIAIIQFIFWLLPKYFSMNSMLSLNLNRLLNTRVLRTIIIQKS